MKRKYSFGKRAAFAYFFVALLMFICGARLVAVNLKGYGYTAAQQGRFSQTIYTHRGTIFDRSLKPLTNIEGNITASVAATPQSIIALRDLLPESKYLSALERLESGKPILLELQSRISAAGITYFDTYKRYSGLAPHIIGYLNGSGNGETGIEADWESLLASDEKTTISYSCDAYGRALGGITPTIDGAENKAAGSGIALTIDYDVQQIIEEETADLGCGAAVVLSPKGGEILAIHSFPAFNQNDPSASLSASDSPFLNRALQGYNAGSVFKTCIAAAALKMGLENSEYVCEGKMEVDGKEFVCNKASGHGAMSLSTALAHSCNVYFYSLALSIPADKLYETAEKMGISREIKLSESIKTSGNNLPSAKELNYAKAAIANFAIGQGDIMVSPLNLAAAYSAIANGGTYYPPKLIAGIVEQGKLSPTLPQQGEQILSPEACEAIKAALALTIREGTGQGAQPEYSTAAGKTATAQTGWKKGGQSVLISWFAGFFPADNPEYVIVVMKEGGTSGSRDCAPIFKKIADRIDLLG